MREPEEGGGGGGWGVEEHERTFIFYSLTSHL